MPPVALTAAAQLYYSALVFDLNVPNFVTVGARDTLSSAVHIDAGRRAFGLSMGLNVGFGVAAYLLVKLQLYLNKTHPKLQRVNVFVAKWIDNAADGATFFSTNLTYTALISSIAFSHFPTIALFWELLLFYILAALFCIAFTAALESAPFLWYKNAPSEGALTTNRMVSDWYIGQWAWFIAFAGWTCLLSLLGDAYLNLYESTWAWWLLDLGILAGYVGYALAPPSCSLATRVANLFSGMRAFYALGDPVHLERQATMLSKSMSWLLGVGLYFTLKKTFPVFANALSLAKVNEGDLAAYVVVTTATCFLGIFLIDFSQQRRGVEGAGGGGTEPVLPTMGGRFVQALETMLKLVFCYITGKAFEAAALAGLSRKGGGPEHFALLGFQWQIGSGVAAVIATSWDIKTQRFHGSDHSAKCVCTVCHPELYEDDGGGKDAKEAAAL